MTVFDYSLEKVIAAAAATAADNQYECTQVPGFN